MLYLTFNPLVTRATFVDRFSSNLQSRLKKVKMEFHFFNFFKNIHTLRYLALKKKFNFVFRMPFLYFSMNLFVILTAYSLEPTEFKSVGIFRLSLFVPEIWIKYFFSFFDLFAVKEKKSKILRFFILQKL